MRMHLAADQGQVLVKGFAERDHRVFAHVVHTHGRRAQQPRHGRGVDDVAHIRRVVLGRGQHHRCEQANAMHHAPDVDAQHPFPVGKAVLPHQAAGPHAGVVEHQRRRAEALLNRLRQRRHLLGVGHVHPLRQHLAALRRRQGADLGLGLEPAHRPARPPAPRACLWRQRCGRMPDRSLMRPRSTLRRGLSSQAASRPCPIRPA